MMHILVHPRVLLSFLRSKKYPKTRIVLKMFQSDSSKSKLKVMEKVTCNQAVFLFLQKGKIYCLRTCDTFTPCIVVSDFTRNSSGLLLRRLIEMCLSTFQASIE